MCQESIHLLKEYTMHYGIKLPQNNEKNESVRGVHRIGVLTHLKVKKGFMQEILSVKRPKDRGTIIQQNKQGNK